MWTENTVKYRKLIFYWKNRYWEFLNFGYFINNQTLFAYSNEGFSICAPLEKLSLCCFSIDFIDFSLFLKFVVRGKSTDLIRFSDLCTARWIKGFFGNIHKFCWVGSVVGWTRRSIKMADRGYSTEQAWPKVHFI